MLIYLFNIATNITLQRELIKLKVRSHLKAHEVRRVEIWWLTHSLLNYCIETGTDSTYARNLIQSSHKIWVLLEDANIIL